MLGAIPSGVHKAKHVRKGLHRPFSSKFVGKQPREPIYGPYTTFYAGSESAIISKVKKFTCSLISHSEPGIGPPMLNFVGIHPKPVVTMGFTNLAKTHSYHGFCAFHGPARFHPSWNTQKPAVTMGFTNLAKTHSNHGFCAFHVPARFHPSWNTPKPAVTMGFVNQSSVFMEFLKKFQSPLGPQLQRPFTSASMNPHQPVSLAPASSPRQLCLL